MDAQDRLRMLAKKAERIVQDHLGREVILRDPTLIARRERSLVVRCAVMGWDGMESVVLKRYEGDDERGFTDWASLWFLSTLEEAAGVAPRFYAGDAEERIVVMEDLGGSRSLEDVLDQGDPATAISVLRALAVAMARLITATYNREGIFEQMRAELPGAEGLGRRREARRWLEACGRVVHWADVLGIRLPRGFNAACEYVATVYAAPGAYLAFSHGDPAPSNNHIAGDRVRLVDFEYAGCRHALYDMTAWDILCPLPTEWVAVMQHVFRRSVGASLMDGAMVDDERYREARATMCAYRALAMVTWLSPDLLVQDCGWVPGWTRRQALISTTLRLHQICAGVVALEPLAELGAAMARELRTRWPTLGDGALRWSGVAGTGR